MSAPSSCATAAKLRWPDRHRHSKCDANIGRGLSSRQTCVMLITQFGTMGVITFCEFMYFADHNPLRCCYDCMCCMRRSADCEFARDSGKN